MKVMSNFEIPEINGILNEEKVYGDGIIIGKTKDNKAVLACFKVGIDAPCNSMYENDGETVTSLPFDVTKKTEEESVFSAVRQTANRIILSNGSQTDTICDYLDDGKSFKKALEQVDLKECESVSSPRVSGILTFDPLDFEYEMNIVKSCDEKGSACNRFTFSYVPCDGVGHFLSAFGGEEQPVEFCGEPKRVKIPDNVDDFASQLWNCLNKKGKTSLYVKYVDISTEIIAVRLFNTHKEIV